MIPSGHTSATRKRLVFQFVSSLAIVLDQRWNGGTAGIVAGIGQLSFEKHHVLQTCMVQAGSRYIKCCDR